MINPAIASTLDPYPLKLYVTLACAMIDETLKLSIAELAAAAGMSERSVIKYTAELEQAGILAVARSKRGSHADINTYRFIGEAASCAPNTPETSASCARNATPHVREMQRKDFNDSYDDESISIESSESSVANGAHEKADEGEGHDPALQEQDNFAAELKQDGVRPFMAHRLAASKTSADWQAAKAVAETQPNVKDLVAYAIAVLRNGVFGAESTTVEAGREWIDENYEIHYEPPAIDYFGGEFGMFVEGGPKASATPGTVNNFGQKIDTCENAVPAPLPPPHGGDGLAPLPMMEMRI